MSRGLRQDGSLPGRLFLFAVIAVSLAHLALLLVWLATHPVSATTASSQAGETATAYVDFTGPRSPTPSIPAGREALHPPKPSPEPDTVLSRIEPIAHPENLGLPAPRADREPEPVPGPALPPSLAVSVGPTQPSDPCHLALSLQKALQSSVEVQGALALIPQDALSVANAVMLWDGRWVSVNMADSETRLEPIRAIIIQTLTASSADCRDRLNNGPILLSITGTTGTIVLALGSGSWRAEDIIGQGASKK